MNRRDLEYLVAVAKHRHFGKASEACFVSQPALSMQLKKLSERLGVQIFEIDLRNKKKILITPTGQRLIEQAQKILLEFKTLEFLAKENQALFDRTLTVGIIPTMAPYLLPYITSSLTKKYPKLKIRWQEKQTHELLKALRAGEIEGAVLSNLNEPDLTTLLLGKETFDLAVPLTHVLAKKTSATLSDLEGETLLLLEEGHCLKAQALEVCHLNGAIPEAFSATSLETLRHVVAGGLGITLMPHLARRAKDGICYLPFRKSAPYREINLVFRTSFGHKPLFEKLADVIKPLVGKALY